MLIDWFTVGAQALNFLILVWLLKRFLYRPIIDAVDAREKLIAKERADADAIKTTAEAERDALQKKNAAFDRQRADLLDQATKEAAAERQRLLDDAAKAADAVAAKRQTLLRQEATSLDQDVTDRARAEVFAIAGKVLKDLAGASLEERVGDIFIRQLQGLGDASRSAIAGALKTASGPALVRSSFEMPETQQEAIQDAIDKIVPAKVPLRFETAPALIGAGNL